MFKIFMTLGLCIFFHGNCSASTLPDYPFIHTTGFAYANVRPDVGEIIFDLATVDADAERAYGLIREQLTTLRSLMSEQAISDNDFAIRQLKKRQIKRDVSQTEKPAEGQETVNVDTSPGYEFSSTIWIKVRDLSKWESIVGYILKQAQTDKIDVTFDATERSQLELYLASAAIDDAKRKATRLAAAAENRLVRVTAISEGRIKNLTTSIGLVNEASSGFERDGRYQVRGEEFFLIPDLKLQAAIDMIFAIKKIKK
jgi:uncharacterized protein YggE